VYAEPRCLLVHERLAIVDPAGGAQPLLSGDGRLALAVNGEIYNHRELERGLASGYEFQSGSDCEVINALYLEHGPEGVAKLNGIYAFALWDAVAGRYLIARDPARRLPAVLGPRWRRAPVGRLGDEGARAALPRRRALSARACLRQRQRRMRGYHERAWRSYDAVAGVRCRARRCAPASSRRCTGS
jgi:asparagine synthase (glutamine-hydrolysing)